MKIFHFITSFAMGGAERVAFDLAISQVKLGNDVYVIGLRRPPINQKEYSDELKSTLSASGVYCIDLGEKKLRLSLLFILIKSISLAKKIKPEIINSHADPAEFVVSFLSRFYKGNYVRIIHNTVIWPTHKIIGFFVEHLLKSNAVVGVSHAAIENYRAHKRTCYSYRKNFETVILNGVKIKEEKKKNFSDITRFAFIGRSAEQKGLDILISAINILRDSDDKRMSFHIYSDFLDKDINEKKISVEYLGIISNAREIMSNYDFIIVPSRFEGLPLVPLEAMASGVPVLVSDSPGVIEVTPDKWPLVFKNESCIELANIIKKAASTSKDEREEMIDIALNNAKKFSFENQVAQYNELYRKIR